MELGIVSKIVAEFVSGMPREIGKQLADVNVIICESPEKATAELGLLLDTADGEPIEPIPGDCKGVFIGEPLEREDEDEEGEFETVSLPNGVIALISANLLTPEEVVLITLHEIGHALGMDEDDVKALGLGVLPTGDPNGSTTPTHGN